MRIRNLFLVFLIVFLIIPSVVFAVPTLREYNNTGNTVIAYVYDVYWETQTFTVGATGHNITSVKVYGCAYAGLPPTDLTFQIRTTDANGKPTSTILVQTTIDASLWSTVLAWHEVTLTETTLTANTKYALLIHGVTGNHIMDWSASPNYYASGSRVYSVNSGSSWTVDTNYDFLFEIWGNPSNTYLTENGVIYLNQTMYEYNIMNVAKNGLNTLSLGQSSSKSFQVSLFGTLSENFDFLGLFKKSAILNLYGLMSFNLVCQLISYIPDFTVTGGTLSGTFIVLIIMLIVCIILMIKRVPLISFVVGIFTMFMAIWSVNDTTIPFSPIFNVMMCLVGVLCMLINVLDMRK